jgi:hypothetical protein
VNVLAFAIVCFTAIPVALAQRLMRDTGVLRRGAAASSAAEAGELTAP